MLGFNTPSAEVDVEGFTPSKTFTHGMSLAPCLMCPFTKQQAHYFITDLQPKQRLLFAGSGFLLPDASSILLSVSSDFCESPCKDSSCCSWPTETQCYVRIETFFFSLIYQSQIERHIAIRIISISNMERTVLASASQGCLSADSTDMRREGSGSSSAVSSDLVCRLKCEGKNHDG